MEGHLGSFNDMFWSRKISPRPTWRARSRTLHICSRSHAEGNSRSPSAHGGSGRILPAFGLYLFYDLRLLSALSRSSLVSSRSMLSQRPGWGEGRRGSSRLSSGRKADAATNGRVELQITNKHLSDIYLIRLQTCKCKIEKVSGCLHVSMAAADVQLSQALLAAAAAAGDVMPTRTFWICWR